MSVKRNIVIGLIALLLLSAVGMVFSGKAMHVYATETIETEVVEQEGDVIEEEVEAPDEVADETPGIENELFEPVDNPLDPGFQTVNVDDVSQWIDRKGFEIIGLLQKFVQPFAIIIFIGSGLMALFGAFGNGKMVSRGVAGMLTAAILYVVVLYAPEIMDIFLNFIKS